MNRLLRDATHADPHPHSAQQSRLFATRQRSLARAAPLSAEDMTVQACDDASPAKWHLAHVTWFFETFVLLENLPGYCVYDPAFNYCFNSYYESQGARQPRSMRGLLTRPSLDSVLAYRAHVDAALAELFAARRPLPPELASIIELGINHEQQHQELLLTDILALFAASPLRPAYHPSTSQPLKLAAEPADWIEFPGGIHKIGHEGTQFAWDNESPRHDALIHPFRLADRLVTNGEWLDFIADGGYRTASLWLADGYAMVQREGWPAPLYWEQHGADWQAMSLAGMVGVDRAAPVTHVSYFEADAFARWTGHRLPTEFEWETAAAAIPSARAQLHDMFGAVWQWTQSAYLPYPHYRPPEGAIGEYNGKFMVSQQVLRGSSFATPPGHARTTYRNFFYPHHRWQFTGLRLASDIR